MGIFLEVSSNPGYLFCNLPILTYASSFQQLTDVFTKGRSF